MIFWGSGGGPRLFGCGTALVVCVIIAVLVSVLSGGQCMVIMFP